LQHLEVTIDNLLMKITRESTGELTATIRMDIEPADYQEVVSKKLKDYQRKANIPGFRPGKVPSGMIRKMYGKAVMADEINTLLSDNLSSFLVDEKLDILGNPLPNREKIPQAKFEDGESFTFYFDIGLTPEIHLSLNSNIEVPAYLVRIEEEMVDRYVDDLRMRHGSYSHPETAGSGDMIAVTATETDPAGIPLEKGLVKNAFLYIDKITEEKARNQLMDLRKDQHLVIRPVDFFGSAGEATAQLNLPAGTCENPELTFSLKCDEITHNDPAELGPQFFTKVYPGEAPATLEDFRDRVRKDAASSFSTEADKLLYRDSTQILTEKTDVPLPDPFLKRWMLEQEENKLTEEEIENQYPSFARSMRWQLIENKLVKEYQLKVGEEEIRNYIRTRLLHQVSSEFADPEMAKKYESIVDAFMQNKEQTNKIYDQLIEAKLLNLFKEKLTLNPVEISYGEFLNLVSGHDHHHDHSPDEVDQKQERINNNP